MSTNENYDAAVAQFNQRGTSTADNIAYTYDSNKNVLVSHHENLHRMGRSFSSTFWLTAGSALVASNSAHNAWTAPDWETAKQEMPAVSLGLAIVFGTIALMNKRQINKIVKAVDRDVQDCVKNKTQPHL
jgi:hypothetical protein